MKTPVMTFRAYEWLRAFVEVGFALLIASAATAWYFYNEVIPAVIAEENVRAAKAQVETVYSARNGCDWFERDERLVCRAKRGVK